MHMTDQQEKMAKLFMEEFSEPADAIPAIIDALLRLNNATDCADVESAANDFGSAVDELHGDFDTAINGDWPHDDQNAEHVLGRADLL